MGKGPFPLSNPATYSDLRNNLQKVSKGHRSRSRNKETLYFLSLTSIIGKIVVLARKPLLTTTTITTLLDSKNIIYDISIRLFD